MRPRVALGRWVIRLGRFIESLAPAVMRPDDLEAFSKQWYNRAESLETWGNEEIIAQGLTPMEEDLLAQVPLKQGRLLLLGLGGGREAIALARRGYEVVGVDFIGEMVAKARENAAQQGLQIEGLVQEWSQLEVPPLSFDLGLLFAAMYSAIPTRKRRVAMLQRIVRALKPGGYFICQFLFDPRVNRRLTMVSKAVAFLTLGNFWYEAGDRVWGGEFVHGFASLEELKSEFAEGGFKVLNFSDHQESAFMGAVLRRSD